MLSVVVVLQLVGSSAILLLVLPVSAELPFLDGRTNDDDAVLMLLLYDVLLLI